MSRNLRDHGYGPGPKTTSAPKAVPITDPVVVAKIAEENGCPNCHCLTIMEVTVDVEMPLVGGPGVGRYLGCPACPWASQMVCVRADARCATCGELGGEHNHTKEHP